MGAREGEKERWVPSGRSSMTASLDPSSKCVGGK
jgi:hypothetical protein